MTIQIWSSDEQITDRLREELRYDARIDVRSHTLPPEEGALGTAEIIQILGDPTIIIAIIGAIPATLAALRKHVKVKVQKGDRIIEVDASGFNLDELKDLLNSNDCTTK
ncbi:hypothetical protein [Promicromonospora sp. AC04]|uniref:effector-associated constant component EACC1 n=1 Tax=Promicromonospora sp. AC04 TaxID=2135723 RepID=UPI000D397CFF|nr:hypothetical protein [Promicromonospora sp. AC04]